MDMYIESLKSNLTKCPQWEMTQWTKSEVCNPNLQHPHKSWDSIAASCNLNIQETKMESLSQAI